MFIHKSVFYQKILDHLKLKEGDVAIDCTCGGGGHSLGLLELVGSSGIILGIDRDQEAVNWLQSRFNQQIKDKNFILCQDKFSNIKKIVKKYNLTSDIKAIIADVGVSSHQLDTAQRGFSFQTSGPLDMRMDQSANYPLSASSVVNDLPEADLAEIIKTFGEEPFARRIAKAIVKRRQINPFVTTDDLAKLVTSALPYKKSKKHPATKTFQALRIFVNKELEELECLIQDGFSVLAKGGRLAIISFHSLEDKIVKKEFRKLAGLQTNTHVSKYFPLTDKQLKVYNKTEGKIIRPFPVKPTDEEINENPRARSAKLRIIEKII